MPKPQSNKAKGRNAQKAIRDKLISEFGLEEGDVESRSMGAGGVDLMLSPLARRVVPLSVEAKKTRKAPARAEVEQSRANAYPNTLPVVVWSPHGSGPGKELLICDFGDFIKWFKDVRSRETALSNEGGGDV
jgi:hypothetical protein